MNDYISKPVDQAILLAKLAEIAQRLDGIDGLSPAGAAEPVQSGLLAMAGIDVSCLDTLNAVMEPVEVRDFLEMYIGEAAERVARMVARGSCAEIGGEAHALIGMSGNVGAMQVSNLARTVEMACKEGDLDAAQSSLRPLTRAIKRSSDALAAWLRDQPA